jgi:hypothetical protein
MERRRGREDEIVAEAMRIIARRRQAQLTPEQRSEQARNAVLKRWVGLAPEERAAQSYWAKLTPKQRSAEMKRRARARNQNRARKAKSS